MNLFKVISNYIYNKRDYAINLTKALIEIPTVNPPGDNYLRIADLLEKELKMLRLATKRIRTPKSLLAKHGITDLSPRISLIADWRAGAGETLHVNGHYDVVPAIAENWKTPPFKAVLKGDKLYGRGAEDMKGTIAGIILSVKALRSLGLTPKINIQLSFTPDEETGGMTGFGWLVKSGSIKADYGLSEGYTGRYVSCGNKGVLWARVECIGKSAHASVPYRGKNSFDALLEAAIALKKLQARLKKRKTMFRMREQKDRFSTMVMGGELSGGGKVNIVPSNSGFTVDRRLIPEEDLKTASEELLDIINSVARKNKKFRFRVKILAQDEPVVVDPGEKICRAVSGAVRAVKKTRPRMLLMPGATDTRYLVKKGIPSVGYSARGGESWHGDNEYVYVSGILSAAKVYAMTMLNLK